MKNLTIIIIVFLAISCSEKQGTSIIIKNESATPIDSIRVMGAGASFLIMDIMPGQEKKQDYTVKGESNYESDFYAKFYAKDTAIEVKSFGYYNNTKSIPSEMKLVLQKDLKIVQNVED